MLTRFSLAAWLASLVALIVGRDDGADRVDRATRSSALYTDGFIIRMVEGDKPGERKLD